MTSNTEPLRIGVLGVGRIGSMHVDLLANRTEGGTVTGVFDVHDEGARAVC